MRHIHVQIGTDPIPPSRQQMILERLEVFFTEHLQPLVLSGVTCEDPDTPWDIEFRWDQVLRIELRYSTGTVTDVDLDRQIVRYLELTVVPTVLFDEVPLQLASHDLNYEEEAPYDCGYCVEYFVFTDSSTRLVPTDVNTTQAAYAVVTQ